MVYKGKIVDLKEPVVMAIVNLTTDSFFDGGSYLEEKALIERVKTQLEEGAKIIDLGGCSSRPGATRASQEQELERIDWGIRVLKREFADITLSIDTYRAEVAMRASQIWGEIIVNDISAGEADEKMLDFVASEGFPYIAMHYQNQWPTLDITSSVMRFFAHKCEQLERKGIKDVILDVGFGFGKSLEDNFKIVKDFEVFKALDRELLVGVSRKSMIYKTLDCTAQDALIGTAAINSILVLKGAKILRVHDSKEAVEVIKLMNKVANCQ